MNSVRTIAANAREMWKRDCPSECKFDDWETGGEHAKLLPSGNVLIDTHSGTSELTGEQMDALCYWWLNDTPAAALSRADLEEFVHSVRLEGAER